MIPWDTVYRCAASERDYRKCKAFMAQDGHDHDLRYPTLMALRAGQLVGMMGTEPSEEAILCGPLVVDKSLPNPSFVIMRLWDAYEALMAQAGVQTFMFYVRRDNTRWLNWCTRLGVEIVGSSGEFFWFQRGTKAWQPVAV